MSYLFLLQEDQPYQFKGKTFKFFAGVEPAFPKKATATFKFEDRTVIIKYTMLTRKYTFMNKDDPLNQYITFNIGSSVWMWERGQDIEN